MTNLPLIDSKTVILSPHDTVLRALQVMDSNTARMALVMDDDGKLIGSIVDGDVRRGILRGATLESNVSLIMHKKPMSMPIDTPRQKLLEAMRTHDIRQIPLIADDGSLKGVVVYDMLVELKRPIRDNPVIIMAGGKGRRLMPLTTDVPKPMVPIAGRPMLEWIILRLTHYGFRNFTVAVNYLGHVIEEYFGNGHSFDCNITYLREDLFLGTAGALSLIDKKLQHPMLVMNGDVLTSIDFEKLLDAHIQSSAAATICARSHQTQVPFGVIKQKDGKLLSMDEKPVYENLINAGMYALSPEVLDYIPKNKVSDMPEILTALVKDGKTVNIYTMQEEWLDVGRHDDLQRAKQAFSIEQS